MLDFSFALFKTGSNIAARIAMMAITTSNSIKVKARPNDRLEQRIFPPGRLLVFIFTFCG